VEWLWLDVSVVGVREQGMGQLSGEIEKGV
jgi:hypothetical protein